MTDALNIECDKGKIIPLSSSARNGVRFSGGTNDAQEVEIQPPSNKDYLIRNGAAWTSGYKEANPVESEYVRQDAFQAHMQRIDQRFEASEKLLAERLDKFQVVMEKSLNELKSGLSGEMKAMNARLDTIQQQYSWKIGWFGTFFTFCGAAIALYPLLSQYLTKEWITATFGIAGICILCMSLWRR